MASSLALRGPPELTTTPSDVCTYHTYKYERNPCIDFFHVRPGTRPGSIIARLEEAWDHDPSLTLKLLCNLRKSNKEAFFNCALWLHKHHPATLALNLKRFAEVGCFKDLVEILFRLLEGQDIRARRKADWEAKKKRAWEVRNNLRRQHTRGDNKKAKACSREIAKALSREDRIRENLQRGEEEKAKARDLRQNKEFCKTKKALTRYKGDPSYRVLHDNVAQVFADYLRQDVMHLNSREKDKISLASKWCPNLGSAYDKATLICESIARRVFPKAEYPQYDDIEDAHYAYRVRDRLRKEVLVPLHKALHLPEIYMGANQWGKLRYNKVPSVAMRRYKDYFLKHDPKRFLKYLDDTVKKEDARVPTLPHDIISSLKDGNSELTDILWDIMVESYRKSRVFRNSIAVCDVSNSMKGNPMDVSVGLGLLISELSGYPWQGKVIPFSDQPELHLIEGGDVEKKSRFIRHMDNNCSKAIDFQEVFNEILREAAKVKIDKGLILDKVFVFTDKEFSESFKHSHCYDSSSASESMSGNSSYSSSCDSTTLSGYSSDDDRKRLRKRRRERSWSPSESEHSYRQRGSSRKRRRAEKSWEESWEAEYKAIRRRFDDEGLIMPMIVFWNLRDTAAPVMAVKLGVVLVNGFSKNMVKSFLRKDGIFTPLDTMELAISGEEYQDLLVYD